MATRFAIQGNYGSVSAAQDCLRIAAPTAGTLKLIEAHVTNDTDETSEMLPFSVYGCSDNGTGTAANIVNLAVDKNGLLSAGAFSGFSAVYNLSGATTKSPSNPVVRESVNILSGYHFVPVPEARPQISGGGAGGLAIRLETAPTNTLSLSVYAIVEIDA